MEGMFCFLILKMKSFEKFIVATGKLLLIRGSFNVCVLLIIFMYLACVWPTYNQLWLILFCTLQFFSFVWSVIFATKVIY
jgi:hypothetical protein